MINKLKFDVFLSGDIIVKEGTIGEEMFFLRKGIVEVASDGVKLSHLTDGGYFGGKTYIKLVLHTWCIVVFVHNSSKTLNFTLQISNVAVSIFGSENYTNFQLSETVLKN